MLARRFKISVRHSVIIGALVLLFLLACAARVDAHGLGASFEATSTPYIVDVGYDPVDFVAGYSSRFGLELLNEARDILEYDHAWVRITREGVTVLATGIAKQSLGPTTLLYVFQTPGEYTLHVSYRTEEDVLAEASFPIQVVEDGRFGSFSPWIAAAFVAGFLLATVAFVAWRRIMKKPVAFRR